MIKRKRKFHSDTLSACSGEVHCPKLKPAIEIEGSIHEREDVACRDAIRLGELEDYGIKILQFSNHEVFTDIRKVIWEITFGELASSVEDWIG